MDESLLVKTALDWAAIWHRAQRRKYPTHAGLGDELADGVPYIAHPAGVACILSRHGFGPEVVAAGALHDVVEDCGVTPATLTARFGAGVTALVLAVSEPDKSLAWEERKRAYAARFASEPWEAQAISLADKIDNFRSIRVAARDFSPDGPAGVWGMFKRGRAAQLERFGALAEHARRLPSHALIAEFLDELEAVTAL